MVKKTLLVLIALLLALLAAVFAILHFRRQAQWLTFAECEERGGTAWAVDLFHPDICPDCAAYRECESIYNDYTKECPMCYGPCQECQAQYHWQEACPECNTTCRECENLHLHNFKDEEERFDLCPDCKVCEACREEMYSHRINCPPCVACGQCKEELKKYDDIREVCPDVVTCMVCMDEMGMYPDQCPGGQKMLGKISDAAIWFTCCR